MTAPPGRPRLRSPREVLTALRRFEKVVGYPPTVRELANLLGVGSHITASRYLKDLEERGWITRWPGARGVRVTKKGKRQPKTKGDRT